MKCVKLEIFFDFINNELSREKSLNVSNHLEKCRKCRLKCEALKAQVEFVNQRMDELNPVSIPEPLFIQPKASSKSIVQALIGKIIPGRNLTGRIRWRWAFVLVIVFGILWRITIPEKTTLSNEQTQMLLVAAENFFDDDPKKDWPDQACIIVNIDEENNTVEFIKSSIKKKNIDRKVFDIKTIFKMINH
ncbi:MAG: hypothetical protein ACT6FF_05330 [Methanosarcinaceae archaeon]